MLDAFSRVFTPSEETTTETPLSAFYIERVHVNVVRLFLRLQTFFIGKTEIHNPRKRGFLSRVLFLRATLFQCKNSFHS
jgi:hypothetical protein